MGRSVGGGAPNIWDPYWNSGKIRLKNVYSNRNGIRWAGISRFLAKRCKASKPALEIPSVPLSIPSCLHLALRKSCSLSGNCSICSCVSFDVSTLFTGSPGPGTSLKSKPGKWIRFSRTTGRSSFSKSCKGGWNKDISISDLTCL